jgi:hypothetical protein
MTKEARMTKSEQHRERLGFFISVDLVAVSRCLLVSAAMRANLAKGNKAKEEKRKKWIRTEPAKS